MTRGDTVVFKISVFTPSGDVYGLKDNDKLYFIVKKYPKNAPSSNYLIKKEFNNYQIELNNSDTQYLNYGTYNWECCLFFSDGSINTICNGILILNSELI